MDKQNKIALQHWGKLTLAGILLVGILAGGTMWRGRNTTPEETQVAEVHDEDSEIIHFDEESAKLADIKMAPAQLRTLATGISFNGEITAAPGAQAHVSSLVSGRITRINVAEGDRVKAGQTLAVIESRDIGEAQSAYTQAVARAKNAATRLSVVKKQASAGVFAREPLEAARRADAETTANLRNAEAALRQARTAMDNTLRQMGAGVFANPALETATSARDAARAALAAAKAEAGRSRDQLEASRTELARRERLAAAGSYGQKPVEEARRAHSAAQAQQSAAHSENLAAQSNWSRAKVLLGEGLISQRDADNAKAVYEQSQSRLDAAAAEVAATLQEWERQKKIATDNVAGVAEINAARSQVADAEAQEQTRRAEVRRAEETLRTAEAARRREQNVHQQGIANRRETSAARATLDQAEAALRKARQEKVLSSAALDREERIARQNLNNIAQLQAAESENRAAQADLNAASTALRLLKSSPGGKASIPLLAPIAGTVSKRDVALGETITAEKELMTIIDLSTVALEASVYEKDIAELSFGTPVTVFVDALKNRTFTGKVSFLGAELNTKTRTLTARALIDNPGVLRPGMFARGEISTAGNTPVVTVPENAVQVMDGKSVVFVGADAKNEYLARPIEVGARAKGYIEVKSGVKPGEQVVIEGAFTVKSQAQKGELAEGHGHG